MLKLIGNALCQSSGSYFLSKGLLSPEGGKGGLKPPEGLGI